MRHTVISWTGNVPGYGAARWDGRYAVSVPGQHVETDTGNIEQPPVGDARFLVLPASGPRIACGTQGDAFGWEWDGAWQRRGACCGNNPVIYDAQDRLVLARCAPPTGALGWRYLSPGGTLVTAESTYADKARGLWEYTDLGYMAIGQGAETGCHIRFADEAGIHRALVIPGVLTAKSDARFIRVSRNEKRWAITVVCLREHQTVCWWGTTDELRAMPVLVVFPPEPEPEPEPEPPTVNEPENIDQAKAIILASLNAAGLKAINGGSNEATISRTADAVCAAVHRARAADGRWGMLAKTSGNRWKDRAIDIATCLDNGVLHHYDVVKNGEGDEGKDPCPTWRYVGVLDASRFALPYPLAPAPEPEPEPEPEPPPTPEPPDDHAEIRRRLDALDEAVAQLRAEQSALRAEQTDQAGDLFALADKVSKLRVKGSTSRVWSHGHDINLKVEAEP